MTSRESTPAPKETEMNNKNTNNKDTSSSSTLSPDLTQTEARGEDTEKILNPEDLIDMNTFEQLLDMDEEDDHSFSYNIVNDYFEQAEATFKDMDEALKSKNLNELSRLGHFLKGSSAAIGLKKVKATCEKIQNIGNCQEEDGSGEITEDEALERITPLLPQVKTEYAEAEDYLKNFYEVQDTK
ncbi:signal transduction histidine kinase [Gilbertella persicaria]|uniref:signal transduction histidine kinase n=1 Tax=Gilbertella persicaria TaxID=101096 RepID=UPI00221FC436|nr:signal transduction histidine kinase [Gilbertella persicaria]KAI8098389.1 signal transduction histidine kinase [Gilbertella persicaria]